MFDEPPPPPIEPTSGRRYRAGRPKNRPGQPKKKRLDHALLDTQAHSISLGARGQIEVDLWNALAGCLASTVHFFTMRPHLAPHAEDFWEEAKVSVLHYARIYKASKGIHAATYLRSCVKFDLKAFARSLMSRAGVHIAKNLGSVDLDDPSFRGVVSLDMPSGDSGGDGGSSNTGAQPLSETMAASQEESAAAYARKVALTRMARLTPDERHVISLVFGIPLERASRDEYASAAVREFVPITIEAVAVSMDISPDEIRRIIGRAISTMAKGGEPKGEYKAKWKGEATGDGGTART